MTVAQMEYKGLFSYVLEMSGELGARYRNSKADKRAVVEFMDANSRFGMEYTLIDKVIHMNTQDLEAIKNRLTLWLSAYRKPGREKTALLLEHFSKTHPETCRLYSGFISDNEMADSPSAWKLLDFLFCEIDREITHYSENDLALLIGRLNSGATRKAARLFAEFLGTKKHNGESISGWTYAFGVRDMPALVNNAYPFEDFARMAYCVYSEEMWVSNRMIEKAAQNKVYADIWVFVALHFICALRACDMERLPAPALPYDSETVLKKIAAGTFSKKEAVSLVTDLRIRLRLKPLYPQKTEAQGEVPELKLFVPESLTAPLGFILAIALSHRPGIRAGDTFVRAAFRMNNLRLFFGNDFMAALGGDGFSPRRCNKSYLQGIEFIGGDEDGKPKGYMLAALARSHKSGIERLSEITDVYLKDARFSGYSPEFIIRQMFERGVFSFIPVALLEIYAGSEFVKLPAAGQTRLICETGLTAFQIENVAETVDCALIRSRNAVSEVIKRRPFITKDAGYMLQNIASGAAVSKQPECLCLMTAAGIPCPFAERGGCIGCGYEIYTKTAMRMIMREYTRLTHAKDAVEPADAQRYEMILDQAVIPAVKEMLESAKRLYPNADISELYDIMDETEEEMDGIDSVTGND